MKKILIVEDSPTILRILEDNFEKEYDVLTAATGEEALEKAKAEAPIVVILDTILPGIDGFGVCSLIKSWQQETIPKVIMMTGSIDAFDALQARKAGADDYCAKTSDCSEIVLAVKKLIG
ncbi:MAG: response regulator [Candidatus Omnitrophota bacterium]